MFSDWELFSESVLTSLLLFAVLLSRLEVDTAMSVVEGRTRLTLAGVLRIVHVIHQLVEATAFSRAIAGTTLVLRLVSVRVSASRGRGDSGALAGSCGGCGREPLPTFRFSSLPLFVDNAQFASRVEAAIVEHGAPGL